MTRQTTRLGALFRPKCARPEQQTTENENHKRIVARFSIGRVHPCGDQVVYHPSAHGAMRLLSYQYEYGHPITYSAVLNTSAITRSMRSESGCFDVWPCPALRNIY